MVTGTAFCLTHVASDKAPWLEARRIDARWPVVGTPGRIGDNAAEFHSLFVVSRHGVPHEEFQRLEFQRLRRRSI
ncbi:hypothetical protein CN173_32780 [Sinorhizobium meliloti]|nr:hypothetical protein CN173_32780 [Sinorhizobium meliloti]